MDGNSLGKAMSGIAYLAMFGMGCALALYVFVPAFIFIGALQVGARLAVGTWYPLPAYWSLYCTLTVLWFGVNAAFWAFSRWHEKREASQRDAKHTDFMRLRKLFYRDNEVCLDNYETLKRRAGEA